MEIQADWQKQPKIFLWLLLCDIFQDRYSAEQKQIGHIVTEKLEIILVYNLFWKVNFLC